MEKVRRYGRGDCGETFLLTGEKIWKDDLRLEALGGLDELSAFIGLARTIIEESEIGSILEEIQEDLFTIGYRIQLAGEVRQDLDEEIKKSLETLESWVKEYESKLPVLRKFILPGGHKSAAVLHIARAVARRVERRLVTLSKKEFIKPEILAYINRISTLLFLLARYINLEKGCEEREWVREVE